MRHFLLVELLWLLVACAPPQAPTEKPRATVEAIPDYNRSEWGRWIDADHDCQDTRQEVLVAESIEPVIFEDDRHCRVKSGHWVDPYTGVDLYSPRDIDIDHVVPLYEAHVSGGWAWPTEKKVAYFNDLGHPEALMATSASLNRSKGAKQPQDWVPSDPSRRCAYLRAWAQTKTAWELESDCVEAQALVRMLGACPP